MVDVVVGAIVFAAILTVAVIMARAYNRRFVPSAGQEWVLQEAPRLEDGQQAVAVWAVCPGKDALLVGVVPWDDPDFNGRIEEVRSEGRMRLVALNSRRLTR